MSDDHTLYELLEDKNFKTLLAMTTDRCITWDEFLQQPQPRDMSPVATWDVLSNIHRSMGIHLLPRDFENVQYWYLRTHEISDISCEITRLCHSGSRIHRLITSGRGQHFLVKSRISETYTAAQLDGIAISQEEIRRILRMNHTPQSSTERLVSNIFQTLERLDEFVDEPFSRELFIHLGDLLMQDVDPSSLKTSPAVRSAYAESKRYTDEQCQSMAKRQMEDTARYLNQEVSGPHDPKALQGFLMSDAFNLYRPLGLVSAQVGRFSAKLHAMKNNLPVLGMLPISETKLAWENGLVITPNVTFNYDTLRHQEMNKGNLTGHQTTTAQLALYTLRKLQSNVDSWERQDAEMRDILHNDPLLNQRQRSIIARALYSSDAEFRIRYHQTNHNIAYTTARRDLLELMEKQYLVMEQRGKAFVFLRGPKLDELEATTGRPIV